MTDPLEPYVNTCCLLEVVSTIKGGAFLRCGLSKDLFVPEREQLEPMVEGGAYIVFIYRDEKTGRVTGSSKLNKHLFDEAPDDMREGDTADLVIYLETDMGYKAAVNGDCWGLLYKNEIFQKLSPGQKIKGYIRKIRPDGRIDLALQKSGHAAALDLSESILAHLKKSGGRAPFTDKTPPEEIYRLFGVSKKKFKMAIGHLYKKRLLVMKPDGVAVAPTRGSAAVR